MDLTFTAAARIAKPVAEVFEAIVNPAQLSRYFTTGGAKGRLETGATVSWDFHDFPGAFPVWVVEVEPERRPPMGGKRRRAFGRRRSRDGRVANSDVGRRMGGTGPRFHTLLTSGRPKQSASSRFCSRTVHAPAKPNPLRSHSIASKRACRKVFGVYPALSLRAAYAPP